MTLILTIANKNGVHQSSDYQLTDRATGKFIEDSVGTKQLEHALQRIIMRVAFTGIASIGSRKTIDWLHTKLASLAPLTELDDICLGLSKDCTREIGSKGVLTLVLAVGEIGKPFRVVRISNSDWTKKPKARGRFIREVRTVQKPFYLVDGYGEPVTVAQRNRLRALSKKLEQTPKDITDELGLINAEAARNSKGCISAGCWVGSLLKDGNDGLKAQRYNVGESKGAPKSELFPQGLDLEKLLRNQGVLAPNGRLGVRQSMTVVVDSGPKGREQG